MSRFALVALLPEPADDATRMDFVSREFDTIADITGALEELEAKVPNWRVISFCHSEDLPLLVEPPDGTVTP